MLAIEESGTLPIISYENYHQTIMISSYHDKHLPSYLPFLKSVLNPQFEAHRLSSQPFLV